MSFEYRSLYILDTDPQTKMLFDFNQALSVLLESVKEVIEYYVV